MQAIALHFTVVEAGSKPGVVHIGLAAAWATIWPAFERYQLLTKICLGADAVDQQGPPVPTASHQDLQHELHQVPT